MKAIMYHYVRRDDPALPNFRHLPLDRFRSQLDYFARHHRLLTRTEFLEALTTKRPVEDGVILTFDDGLKDHYEFVFPELVRRGLFGIFYVPAYPYLTGRMLDVHRTHLLLGRHGGEAIWDALVELTSEDILSHAHVKDFQKQTYRAQSNDDATNKVKRTLNYYIDYQFRPKVIEVLVQRFFPDEAKFAAHFYLTLAELCEMHSEGMILGSHTVNHPCLSKLSASEQRTEITDSFRFLEKVLGPLEPKTFCYPYGGFHSFTAETERLLEAEGCRFSFNVEHRDITAEDLRSRPQALPRYDTTCFPVTTS